MMNRKEFNINTNFGWATLFVKRLELLGVKDVCISPGSRNTPLTLAFAESRKIKQHVIIDERMSGFFALGLAKKSKFPVVVVTTSGTATAELYPAIVEAYLTRIPLIIGTADRPEYLRNTGANQTINQDNPYRNHIRFYADLRLPKLTRARLEHLINITDKAFNIANESNPGPVHLNFPFEKPLEPNSFDAVLDRLLFDTVINKKVVINYPKLRMPSVKFQKKISKASRVLILLGATNNTKADRAVIKLGEILKAPVIADGISSARYFSKNKTVISNGASLVKSELASELQPDIILMFGKAPTTNAVLNFVKKSNAEKILINKFGDLHDPSRTYSKLFKSDEIDFAGSIIDFIKANKIKRGKEYLNDFLDCEKAIEKIKIQESANLKLEIEPKAIAAVLSVLPEKSNLFIGNSTPPRDLDTYGGNNRKEITVYSNRGASGIDGVISTAAGVAVKSAHPTFLIIGDVSFLYDISSLAFLSANKIKLNIILMNNNGGGIFKMLPISNEKKYFDKYFTTSHNLDFEKIVSAFGGEFTTIKEMEDLSAQELSTNDNNGFRVFEIITDSEKSKSFREKFSKSVNIKLQDERNKN
jgi:2-succinyl-5-enolpyruvyl-6-hydroxy-3-cyclohexene-1-carboxylate synthase